MHVAREPNHDEHTNTNKQNQTRKHTNHTLKKPAQITFWLQNLVFYDVLGDRPAGGSLGGG